MNQIEYSPDIVGRIDALTKKALDKKRVLEDFIGIMKVRAELENYYSRHLEKISESLTALIHGKDQLKDIFLIMRNYISIQSEQSRGLARSIQNEVVSDLQALISNEGTWKKETENMAKRHARDVRLYIEKLNQFRQEYVYSSQDEMRLQQNPAYKQKFPKSRSLCENQLRSYIDVYNKYIDQYFADIATVQDIFTNIEVERRIGAQDTAMKFLMFEVSLVRNLQYDLNGISQKLESYNPRNDLSELFKEQPNDKPLLCKLNFLNYQTFLHQQMNFVPNPRVVVERQPQEQQLQDGTPKNKIFDPPTQEVKKRRQIFQEVPLQPIQVESPQQNQIQQHQSLPQLQNLSQIVSASDPGSKISNINPLLLKMFQNALFNNIVSDQAIQNLTYQIDQDISLMQSFSNSLEGIMALPMNQEIQISQNGYVSMIKIIQCFMDQVTINDLNELKNLMTLCKRICQEQTSVWQGISNHKLFKDVNLFISWGSLRIQGKILQFQQEQDHSVFNEKIHSSESEFLIQELVIFLSILQEIGCTHNSIQVIQDQLMQNFLINDQVRENITSQISDMKHPQTIIISSVEESNFENSVLS